MHSRGVGQKKVLLMVGEEKRDGAWSFLEGLGGELRFRTTLCGEVFPKVSSVSISEISNQMSSLQISEKKTVD